MAETASRSRGRLAALAMIFGAIALLAGGAWALMQFLAQPPSEAEASTPATTQMVSERAAKVREALDEARHLIASMETVRAEQVLRDAVDRFPIEQELRLLWAQVLQEQGKRADALAQYEAAITIGPEHAEYRFAAGMLSDDLGRLEDAEAHLRAGQHLDRTNPKYPLYLAAVQSKLGKRDHARANYTIAAQLDPSLAIAWGGLAQIALDENHPESALERARKARAIEPERVAWRVLEARALRRMSKPAEAVQTLYGIPEASRMRDGVVLTEIATCLAMMQRAPEADALFETAAELHPKDPGVQASAAEWFLRYGRLDQAERHAKAASGLGAPEAGALLERIARARSAQKPETP